MSVRSIVLDPPPLHSTRARELSKSLESAEKGGDTATSKSSGQ